MGISYLGSEVLKGGHGWDQLNVAQINDHPSDLWGSLCPDSLLDSLIDGIPDHFPPFFRLVVGPLELI